MSAADMEAVYGKDEDDQEKKEDTPAAPTAPTSSSTSALPTPTLSAATSDTTQLHRRPSTRSSSTTSHRSARTSTMTDSVKTHRDKNKKKVVNGYTIVSHLGDGAFGKVERVEKDGKGPCSFLFFFSFSSLSSFVVAVIEIRSHRSISLKISKHHQLTRIALCCHVTFFLSLSLFILFFYTLFTAWAMKIL